MTKERFETIRDAIRENMQDEIMIGELLAAYESAQAVIDALRALIDELKKP